MCSLLLAGGVIKLGYSGDFKFERISNSKILVRDRFTHERIGDVDLDDDEPVVVRRRR